MYSNGLIEIIDSLSDRVQHCIDYCHENKVVNPDEDSSPILAKNMLSHDEMFKLDAAVEELCMSVRGINPKETEWINHWNQIEYQRKRKGEPFTTSLEAWVNCRLQLRNTKMFVQILLMERQHQLNAETAKNSKIIAKDVIMGDKFENIQNSNIINRSKVSDALKVLHSRTEQDAAAYFSELAQVIDASGNKAAAQMLSSFSDEIQKPEPDKSALKQYWEGIVAILPDVAKIAGAVGGITKLFS